MGELTGRDFLKEVDFTPDEWGHLVELTGALKSARREGREEQRLRGMNFALIFEKSSTRTRAAFEVGARQQGAHTTYLDPSGAHIGSKESAADTALGQAKMTGRSRVCLASEPATAGIVEGNEVIWSADLPPVPRRRKAGRT